MSLLRKLFARAPKTQDLTEEVAKPSATSVTATSPVRKPVASGLTPQGLAALLRRADQGDTEAYFTLASEVEERDPHFASVLATRKLAVSGSPIQVEAASDSTHDVSIADDVSDLLRRPAVEGLITDLLDGISKGFSAVEVIWQRDARRWEPARYEYRDQRHFVWDDTLSQPRLRSLTNDEGDELQPYKWLVHRHKTRSGIPLQTGLIRPVAVAYAAKRFTLEQLLVFLETYSLPVRLGKYPTHMADKKAELLRAIRQIGTDCAAVIPQEMDVAFLETKSAKGNAEAFLGTAEYWDKQISKVVLGQTMSTDDGSSLAQSRTHERVRFDIRDADGRAVAATITRDLVIPFVTLNYGAQKSYPRVQIDTTDPEDAKVLVDVAKTFVSIGGKLQMSSLRDRLGFEEPEPDAELLLPEQVVIVQHAPKAPAPAQPPSPGQPAPAKEANRLAFARTQGTEDVIDTLAADALDDWHVLVDDSIGEMLRRLHACESAEQAQALLATLDQDQGEILDIEKLTRALAVHTFTARGVGDATDSTEGV